MIYGKKKRVGNFEVMKFTRALSGKDVKVLRAMAGIPQDLSRNLQRGTIPFIKVTSLSGSWGVEFVAGTNMFRYIDNEEDDRALYNLFTMMFADTSVMGDKEYWDAKGEALKAFMERQKAQEMPKEEDDKILSDVEESEKAKAVLLDMAEQLRKEEDNGKGQE